jgi:hypothetical protein
MLISTIIPTYNSKEYLERALDSIFIQNRRDVEVIVIDNGSSDNTYEFIKKRFPQVKLIRNAQNRGPAQARNQGIERAGGQYLMFMDCDVILERNFFSNLEKEIHSLGPQIAGISPKIVDEDTKRIFSCGLRITSIYRVYDIGKNKNPDTFSTPFFITGPNSCCAIFKREYLEKVKEKYYFDDDFFFLFEDVDLALRLKNKRFKCLFLPQIICYHSKNSSKLSLPRRKYLCFRNRLYMILKYNKGRGLLFFFLKSFFYDFPRVIYFFLTNRYAFSIFKDLSKKN